MMAALRLSKQLATLPGGYLLRNGFRTAQTWLNYRQFRQLKKLLASPTVGRLVGQYPRLAYKYLVPCMVAGLTRPARLAIIGHHYQQLEQWMRPDFFELVRQQQGLWQQQQGEQLLSMKLAYPSESDFEGELSLLFYVDGERVYTVTFTIAPGWALGLATPSVLLVSRVQGTRNFALIKQATKQMHDSTPAAILLQAVCGLALACGISQVAGISTEAQLSSAKVANQFDYNGFWQQFGAVPAAGGLYWLSLPLPEKPIEAVKANHRPRTLRKRGYKQLVRDSIQREVTCLRTAPSMT